MRRSRRQVGKSGQVRKKEWLGSAGLLQDLITQIMPEGGEGRKIERWVKPHIRPTDSQHSHNKTQKTWRGSSSSKLASSLRGFIGGSNKGEVDQCDVETTKQTLLCFTLQVYRWFSWEVARLCVVWVARETPWLCRMFCVTHEPHVWFVLLHIWSG